MTRAERTPPLRALFLSLFLLLPGLASAQGLFAPVVQVNDKVVTQFEVDQRLQFMTLLRQPDADAQEATDRLVDERLQVEAAERDGIALTPDQIKAGEEEFASRANLGRDEFIAALEQGGVSEESFRDFVKAGLLWREVIRKRYGSRVTISDVEVNQALSSTTPQSGGVRILYSELVLPARSPEEQQQAMELATQLSQITSIEAFSRAARDYSAAPSRDRGGRVDWVALDALPPGLGNILLSLAPGQVSAPLPINNAVALFQLRAIDDKPAGLPTNLVASYAVMYLPGGRSPETLAAAARIKEQALSCGNLDAIARKQPAYRLVRDEKPLSEIPGNIAGELAKLDEGESSTSVTADGNLALVMLCSRRIPLPEGTGTEQVRTQLQNQTLSSYAEAYLAELRANAIIRYP